MSATADREYELKFVLRESDLRSLTDADWLRELQQGKARTQQLNAVYYDTPGLALRRRRAILRVRKEGGKYVQCVKTPAGDMGGRFARHEWEAVVPDGRPSLALIPGSGMSGLAFEADLVHLGPVFDTHIRRTARELLLEDGTRVELDIDVGEIRAGDKVKLVCECEIELLSGEPRRLFDLGFRLLETVPARLSTLSKSDSGYALLETERQSWHRANRVALAADVTAEQALMQMVRSALDHLCANEECVLNRSHVEGVHQMRVAVRRISSALLVYRKLLPPEQYDEHTTELSWLLQTLGPVRDWDVFVDTTLAPVIKALPEDPSLELLRQQAQQQRDAAYDVAREAILSRRYGILLLRLHAWLHDCDWRRQRLSEWNALLFGPAAALAQKILSKRHKKLLKKGKDFENLDAGQRHALRIATKKLRYASEFFEGLYPRKKVKMYLAALKNLQDILGKANDLVVARQLIDSLEEGGAVKDVDHLRSAGGILVGWYTAEMDTLHRKQLAEWREFRKQPMFW